MTKRCRFNPRIRCWWFSCSRIESISGKVVFCRHFCGNSVFTPRTVKPDLGFLKRGSGSHG